MTNMDHLRARRTAQAIERLCRHVRRLRQRGLLTEAEVEVSAFECGGVLAVAAGIRRRLVELVEEAGS